MLLSTDPDTFARQALRLLGPAPDNWVPDQPGIDHNVTVVGGGQTGCGISFALRRAGIGRVSVIDAAPDADKAGVWLNRARMKKLRTPKNLVGPELGIQGLGFQAWFEARHGEAAFAALDFIPRPAWADYLRWYRTFLDLPVRYGTRLLRIEPVPGEAWFRLHLAVNGVRRTETTRKIVLANGVAGSGAAAVPPLLQALPAGLWAHTSHDIDFASLRGKTVAVVGAAASAFDAAATALEAGAAAVHLFARRATIASVPVGRARGYPGAYDHYASLPDGVRWQQALRLREAGSTPPIDALKRVLAFPRFHLHLASPWSSAEDRQGRIHAVVGGAAFDFDFAIAGTGYVADAEARPELADLAPHIRLWRDQFTPPPGEEDAGFGAHPYLGEGLEYLEKAAGQAPYLRHVHVYNPGGMVSRGVPLGDVPSMRRDIPALVSRIGRDLLLDDLPAHERRLRAEVPADFPAEVYAQAVWRSQADR